MSWGGDRWGELQKAQDSWVSYQRETHPGRKSIFLLEAYALAHAARQGAKGAAFKRKAEELMWAVTHEVERLMGRATNPRLSAGMKPSDFNARALREGTKIEMEHTDNRKVAQRIAMDHLVEDPQYYVKLRAIEGKKGPYRLVKKRKKNPKVSIRSIMSKALK